MNLKKIEPMEFSDNLYKLIYSNDVNIEELKKVKTRKEIWDDIILFLAKDDVTKMKDVKNMPAVEVFSILNSKLKAIPKVKEEIKPIGFKSNENNN
jgi:hypothetical protein